MEFLTHLQFKHRKDRNYGIVVTEREYWAIRNIVQLVSLDKGLQ